MADAAGSERVTGVAEERRADRRGMVLALATVGFLVNLWAWALISPLGVAYREQRSSARRS
jgi:NNP family nitrate/nitrite transporter-like MFS transporter